MYLPDTQEQFRIQGKASLHGADTTDDLLRQVRGCSPASPHERCWQLRRLKAF